MNRTTKRPQRLMLSSAALGLALAALGTSVASASEVPTEPTDMRCSYCNVNHNETVLSGTNPSG